MFLPRQLFFPTLIIFLLSCKGTDKQKEQTGSQSLIKDTIVTVPKQAEKFQDTALTIAKQTSTINILKYVKSVLDNLNIQVQTSLESDFKIIDQGFQNFELNPNLDTILICKQGTVLTIHRSSFLIASNLAEVTGTIALQVKEYYSISDILSARLTTHSGDNILETGGMLFIQATSDGQLCKLKDNSPIDISFPFVEKKDSMYLFSGSWINKKIDWEKLSEQKAPLEDKLEEANFKGNIGRFFSINTAFEDSLRDRNINERVLIDFEISENGEASILKIRNTKDEIVKRIITKAFEKMPLWKPAKRNGSSIKSTKTLPVIFLYDERKTDNTVFKDNFENTFTDTTINTTKASVIRSYIFSTSKLGWINCDRFINSQKPKTDFYVSCGNYTDIDTKLVFHSFKSVLDGYVTNSICKFQGIPTSENVTVVVIKKINDKTFVSLTECNTSTIKLNNLNFESVTMDKLKQKLQQLNNLR